MDKFSLQESQPGQEWLEGRLILLDKPLHWTSFQLTKKVRVLLEKKYRFKKLKVGHAGTLDPLATGLMIIGTGKMTKQLSTFQSEEKEYVATIRFGATTPSFDLETAEDQQYPFEHITYNRINKVLDDLSGLQWQTPPLFSAKKVKGIRAYEMARKGQEQKLTPVQVHFYEFEILNFSPPELRIRVVCSKGTYLRAFARDLGIQLHSGAFLTGLRRLRSGRFNVENAQTLESFEKSISAL
ncbi:MAG: tRNA pseudouridine(55) synthase TruB [Bacteroidales bacterium]|nr:tRNA pseudouridine(55) synthase TruB [Bacteroidales bacterium]